jgi:beta-glucosidase/6-phospho-beta-glucosidase/beta-galactosidase
LREQQEQFPGKPIILIENGCTTTADGIARADYIARHLRYVQRAVDEGVPVAAYLCWSITSNREWGLPFDNASDFGLYHIDLDHDPNLTRVPTPASERYKEIITARSAEV